MMLEGAVKRAAALMDRRELLVKRQSSLEWGWENRPDEKIEVTVEIVFPAKGSPCNTTTVIVPFTVETLEFLLGALEAGINAIDEDLQKMGVE